MSEIRELVQKYVKEVASTYDVLTKATDPKEHMESAFKKEDYVMKWTYAALGLCGQQENRKIKRLGFLFAGADDADADFLKYTSADVDAMSGIFKELNIEVNENAIYKGTPFATFENHFSNLKQNAEPDKYEYYSYFYISSHGMRTAEPTYLWDANFGIKVEEGSVWEASSYEKSEHQMMINFVNGKLEGVKIERFLDLIQDFPGKKIFFVDLCHAEQMITGILDALYTGTIKTNPDDYKFVFSCTNMNLSWMLEYPLNGIYGAATENYYTALAYFADNKSEIKKITMKELANRICKEVIVTDYEYEHHWLESDGIHYFYKIVANPSTKFDPAEGFWAETKVRFDDMLEGFDCTDSSNVVEYTPFDSQYKDKNCKLIKYLDKDHKYTYRKYYQNIGFFPAKAAEYDETVIYEFD